MLGACSRLLVGVDHHCESIASGEYGAKCAWRCGVEHTYEFMHVDMNDTCMLTYRCILTKKGHHTRLHTPGSSGF
ncbi:MAG: hypothetical protein QOF38_5132 [Pseudonocardiales bacterium]|nr:hypothetical protein [Pseudonocardiales bacterium]